MAGEKMQWEFEMLILVRECLVLTIIRVRECLVLTIIRVRECLVLTIIRVRDRVLRALYYSG